MHKQKPRSKAKGLDPRELLRRFRQFRVPDHRIIDDLIEEFFIAIDTPVSLACYMLYKYNEHDQLVSKEIFPHHYNDALGFRSDFASVSFLRKCSTLRTTFQRKKIALDSFAQAEELCMATNIRLNPYCTHPLQPDDARLAIIKIAKRKIYGILRRFDVDEFLDLCTWGPGSTLLVKGEGVSASHKFDIENQMTREAHYLFGQILASWNPRWDQLREVNFRAGNKVVTVPKNAKTDRTIAIEPGLNSWVQLGIGKLMRKRLRGAGIDLNSDYANQRGAFLGSRNNQLATLDFKAASDTISRRTVELLLPDVWFSVLDSARSQYYTLGPDTKESHKFSTMGNGFTFELESLIFYSLGFATCEYLGVEGSPVSIFGDDLILPGECVGLAKEVFSYLGFTINDVKSFSDTYFRESCGSYYFNGVDVKPYFLKRAPWRVKDLYRFANSIRALSHRWAFGLGCDKRFYRLWSLIVDTIPKELRFFGPVQSGDATIHCDLNDHVTQRASGHLDGFYYRGFPEVPIHELRDSYGVLLAKLFRPSTESLGNEIPKRARTKIIYKKRMFVHRWCDTYSWIKL